MPWQVGCFGKRNVLRFDLKESREGLCRRGRGRSFQVEGKVIPGRGAEDKRCGSQQQKVWCKKPGG